MILKPLLISDKAIFVSYARLRKDESEQITADALNMPSTLMDMPLTLMVLNKQLGDVATQIFYKLDTTPSTSGQKTS